jgi:2,4-dichlorophenol 6-monooxygenase
MYGWSTTRDAKPSTLDVTGKGKVSLLTGLAGGAWIAAADKLELPYLRTVVVGAEGSQDLYHEWHRAREIEEAGALLVRPDGYIAWRHSASVWDEEEAVHLFQAAIDAVLSTSV